MIKIKILSSLEKVFKNREPDAAERLEFSCLKNEALSFQAAVCSDIQTHLTAEISGEFKDSIKVFTVGDVPVTLAAPEGADDYYISKQAGEYPDILYPGSEISAEAGKWYSFWFELIPGDKTGKIPLVLAINGERKTVIINICDALLPPQELIYTNWFHCDAICDYYKVKAFSEEFWMVFRNFAGTAAAHGMNCILTPLFTPALDTAVGSERTTTQLVGVKRTECGYSFDFSLLKKWVEICRSAGIEYFEMSHFFTQWGAEHAPKIMCTDSDGKLKRIFGWETETHSADYDDFLTALSAPLKEFIYENKLEGNVFFHISDEPDENHMETYIYRAGLIRKLFGEFKIIDALSDYEFYEKGAVDIPIPCENSIEEFYGRVKPLWTYYCCGQCNENVPNRFIAMPSERNRILGILLFKYDIGGFLQWGYNFYNTQYSLMNINPYEVTDAGGKFPSGDSFVVYPGENGTAVSSLRLKVFREALQDLRALKLLEKLSGREKALEIIGDITFKNYPHDPEYILGVRDKIHSAITAETP